ncbi:MAG: diguanylate cyclase [Butyrivibrio sp.]|nr:diguanylate cyclase [Butyrivibrio sp.]
MIEKLYESYDDNNYFVDSNKKKLAHDNLTVVGGMLTFFVFISIIFVAIALAFGNGVTPYFKFFPAIAVLLIAFSIFNHFLKEKTFSFDVARVISLIIYGIVILSFSIADAVIYRDSRSVFFPLAIVMFSALYIDYLRVRLTFKLAIMVVYLIVDYHFKSRMLFTFDVTVAVLALFASYFSYASMISMSLSRREDSQQLVKKSETDLLTGLLNKMSFEEKCDEYLSKKMAGAKCTMFIFDLDDFKDVNDHYGHQTGDKVLKLFSEILKGYFHPDDLIGRIGGDEFMVLVLGDMPDGYTERRCRSVLHELKTTQIDGASGITCSIGIAEDTQRMTFKELYEKSDKALYKAKEGGKARYCIDGGE